MERFFDTLGALTKAGLAIAFALAWMILGARAADEQYRNARWPALGDQLGLVLEQIFTGQRTNLKGAFDEVAQFASDQLENK